MCTVSNVGSGWGDTVPWRYPWTQPYIPIVPAPNTSPPIVPLTPIIIGVSQEEFDKLKNELEELKKLLRAAKVFDEATGQPDCEVDEKVAMIKALAGIMGVDLEDIFE